MNKGESPNIAFAEEYSLTQQNEGRETLGKLIAEAKVLLIKLHPGYYSLFEVKRLSYENFVLLVIAAVGVSLLWRGLLVYSAWSEYFIAVGAVLILVSAVVFLLNHQRLQRRKLLERRAELVRSELSELLHRADMLQEELSSQEVVEREMEPV